MEEGENIDNENNIETKIRNISDDMKKLIELQCDEAFYIDWYGAYDIDPKYLVYYIGVKTDTQRGKLIRNKALNADLRKLLIEHDYPEAARKHVYIKFESQETVDRESNGNWYHHFK